MRASEQKEIGAREGVHLWLLLWKATKVLEGQARRSVQGTGLGLSDFGVLEALLHKGPLPVNALRQKVLLSSGSTTAAVDRLERSGLVLRSETATDRRTRIVRLTGKGSKLISVLFRRHAADMERAFSSLDKTERDTLASILRRLGRAPEKSAAIKENSISKKEGRS